MKYFCIFTLCLALFCGGCQNSPTNTQKPLKSHFSRYQGPVTLKWDPQLLDTQKVLPAVSFSNEMFKIQASVTGESVFEQTTPFDAGFQEARFSVSAAPQYRHSLTLSFVSDASEVELEVFINAQEVYTGKHMTEVPLLLSRLTLKDTNELKIKVNSSQDMDLTVKVAQQELAGHVFSGQPKTTLPVTTHFVPHGEETGDLRVDDVMPVSGFRLEDDFGLTIPFESDVLLLTLLAGAQDVPEELKVQYGLETRRCLDVGSQRFCSVYFDFEKAPLAELPQLLLSYQQEHPTGFKGVSFSSLRAMQTLALALKLHYAHANLIAGAELNGAEVNSPVFSSTEFPVSTLLADDWKHNGGVFGDSWWLLDTRVREAWLYSLGTGARAAYIDIGWYNTHDEIEPRRFLIQQNSNQTSQWYDHVKEVMDPKPGPKPSFIPGNNIHLPPVYEDKNKTKLKTHGISTVQTGFAERDNGLGAVGVAPNATVIPYSTGTTEGAATSIAVALSADVHVIGVNKSFPAEGSFLTGYTAFQAAVRLAIQQNVPVIVPTGNTNAYPSLGKGQVSVVGRPGNPYVINVIPCGMNEVICVGGAEPYHKDFGATTKVSPPPLRTRGLTGGLPISGQENLWIASHSLFNTLNPLVWAPSNVMVAEATKNGSGAYDMASVQGTSYACPFVTGVVALMKSRNPQLTVEQVRTLLYNNRSIPMIPSDTLMNVPTSQWQSLNYRDGMKLIDVPGALTRAIDLSLSGQTTIPASFKDTYASKNYPGLIERDGAGWALKLNESLNPHAPADQKRKTLIQSVSDVQWAKLRQGSKINVQGWTGESGKIRLGNDFLLPQQIEVLQFDWTLTRPVIHQVEVIQNSVNTTSFSAKQPFEVKITGEHLMADLVAGKSLELVFHEVGSSTQHTFSMDYVQSQENLNNSGTIATFVLDNASDQTDTFLQTGKSYQVSVKGHNGNSNKIGPASGDFRVTAEAPTGSGGGGFGIKSVNPPAEEIPAGHYVYDQVGNRWLKENGRTQVETNDFAGLYFTKPIRQVTVKVGPVELPVVSVLKDLAVLGIPEDLPAGVHELTVEVDGQTLTLKDALEKITPAVQPTPLPTAPPSIGPANYEHLRIFNVEGNDEARVYINGQVALIAHAGDDAYLNIGPYASQPLLRTDQPNEVIFEYENRGGGYTLGYSLETYEPRFYHVQGKAGVQNVLNPDGSEDQRQGVVFRERILIHAADYPSGSGQMWVKVFNMDNGESLNLSSDNITNDIQWTTDRLATPGKQGEWVKQLPWPSPLYCELGSPYSPITGCFGNYYLSFGMLNDVGSYSYGLDIYRGINRVYHHVDGQAGAWGAKENATETGYVSLRNGSLLFHSYGGN